MKIIVKYFALLREERGLSEEILELESTTAESLYLSLQKKYHFKLSAEIVKVAINNQFSSWDTVLNDKDSVVFIPPVAGG